LIDIKEFGIHEGISETIFTTLSNEGVPNAAPVGLRLKNGKLFALMYNSKTLENILSRSAAAANIVDDPVLIVQSALSDIEPDKFEFVDGYSVLKNAQGWILFDCRCKKGENITRVDLTPIRGNINYMKIQPINRGFNAVIEAAVHATRYVISGEQRFLEHIRYYDTIVKKCGGVRSREAMELLYRLIGIMK